MKNEWKNKPQIPCNFYYVYTSHKIKKHLNRKTAGLQYKAGYNLKKKNNRVAIGFESKVYQKLRFKLEHMMNVRFKLNLMCEAGLAKSPKIKFFHFGFLWIFVGPFVSKSIKCIKCIRK